MKNRKFTIVGILVAVVVILVCVLLLIDLNKKNNEEVIVNNQYEELTLISPSGAPALSLVGAINNETVELDYEIVDGGDVLSAEFMSGEKDLIIAPINLGVNLINNGASYQLLGVVTWGNLYVVGNSHYDGTIAGFGQNAVPGRVLNYVSEVMAEDIVVDWYSSVSEVAPLLLNGEYNAALLAEPVKSTVMGNDENLTVIYDIQALYNEMTGYNRYPQAAIFVSTNAISNKTDSVLNLCSVISTAINAYNTDSSSLANLTEVVNFEELGFSNPDVVINKYGDLALNFSYVNECLEEVREFLTIFDIELSDTAYMR